MVCSHSGALGARAASSDHGPSNAMTRASVVARMFAESSEDMMNVWLLDCRWNGR